MTRIGPSRANQRTRAQKQRLPAALPEVTAKTLAIYDPDLPRLLELARVVILTLDRWRSVSYALALTKKECQKPELAEELSRVHRAIVDQVIEG